MKPSVSKLAPERDWEWLASWCWSVLGFVPSLGAQALVHTTIPYHTITYLTNTMAYHKTVTCNLATLLSHPQCGFSAACRCPCLGGGMSRSRHLHTYAPPLIPPHTTSYLPSLPQSAPCQLPSAACPCLTIASFPSILLWSSIFISPLGQILCGMKELKRV